jgi:hypothetical protein
LDIKQHRRERHSIREPSQASAMPKMEELQRNEAAALALQRARKLSARRQRRLQRDKQLFSELQSPSGTWEAASLAELEDAALRPGADTALLHRLVASCAAGC